MPDHRRLATHIAFVFNLEAIALDDALDLLDILATEIFADATRAGQKARLRTLSLPSTHLHVAWIGRALWLRTRIRAKAEWSAMVRS